MLLFCFTAGLVASADDATLNRDVMSSSLLFIQGARHQVLPAEIKTSADILGQYEGMKHLSWQEFKMGSGIHALFVWFDGDMPQVSRPHNFTINVYCHDGTQWRNAGFAFAPTGNLTVVRDLNEGSFSITDRIGKTHLVIQLKDLRPPKPETQSHDRVEQDGAGQPATTPESKPGSEEKPKSESELRPQ